MTVPDFPLISVVSPVYGCRDCLEALVDMVRAAFLDSGLDWELILVDDRGPDAPWDLIVELAGLDGRVRGLRLVRNHGQHLAIWAGLAAARGDWVAVIDCDLQDDPAIIPALHAAAVKEGVDAMVVDRGSWSDSAFRRWASRTFYRMVDLLAGIQLRNIGNFGIYSRRMTDTLMLFDEQEVFLPVMVNLTGLRTGQMQLDRDERLAGESSYSLRRLVSLAIAIIIRFSDRPLKLSVIAGLLFSGLSALISVVLVVAWSTGAFTVPGWTSTILSVWFLSGLIMAVLGVHGFYVGRIFSEVQNRPRILIEQVTGGEDP
ncbi:glycosyltransferase family 2 protein [Tropicimonas sp.]|uniref:glycosyltransferase family 2 protein n=1 Tax=Tropicimonas sp. TaxID=2067044 RepID=UPI003A84885D